MAIPKLKLISKDDGLVKELEKFIYQKNEEQFNILVNRLRKRIYTKNKKCQRSNRCYLAKDIIDVLWNKNFMMR